MAYINNSWQEILEGEFSQPYFVKLQKFLKQEYREHTIYPEKELIYYALELTPFEDVKVVILGQDPYHGRDQAHGLSFSVQPGVEIPPSLFNIYLELENDLGYAPVTHGCLESWARQGVLLLNSILTVRHGVAKSHEGKGWENFTDAIIRKLNDREKPVVFILWGAFAKSKSYLVNSRKHVILTAPHPAIHCYQNNLSNQSFFGSEPFSKANEALEDLGETPIDWELPDEP